MAAKSQSKLSNKSSKTSTASSTNIPSGKTDGKSKKKVSIEDEDEMKAPDLLNKVLTADQCKELLLLGIEEIQDKLCETFQLRNHETDLREASVLDYYTSSVWWAKDTGFSSDQVSGFFTIIHTLLENVKEKHFHVIDNMKELKQLLAGIGLDHGDRGQTLFNIMEAKQISEYIYTSFFQHYKLYEFMYTHTQAEEIIGTDLVVETAKPAHLPFPPPLDEGVTKAVFNMYIATPPPTPPPQEDEMTEGVKDELEKNESDLFANLTADDLRAVVESVADEMLGGLQHEISAKLREKENQLLQRINKIHNVAEV